MGAIFTDSATNDTNSSAPDYSFSLANELLFGTFQLIQSTSSSQIYSITSAGNATFVLNGSFPASGQQLITSASGLGSTITNIQGSAQTIPFGSSPSSWFQSVMGAAGAAYTIADTGITYNAELIGNGGANELRPGTTGGSTYFEAGAGADFVDGTGTLRLYYGDFQVGERINVNTVEVKLATNPGATNDVDFSGADINFQTLRYVPSYHDNVWFGDQVTFLDNGSGGGLAGTHSLAVQGSIDTDTHSQDVAVDKLIINGAYNADYSGISFTHWTPGVDTVTINTAGGSFFTVHTTNQSETINVKGSGGNIFAGAGDDTIVFSTTTTCGLDGGTGANTVKTQAANVTFNNLANVQNLVFDTGNSTVNVYATDVAAGNFHNITGSADVDTLVVTHGGNGLVGGPVDLSSLVFNGWNDSVDTITIIGGDGQLTGTNHSDHIKGAGGHGVINGGAGADFLFGGAGADTFVFDATALGDAKAATPLIDHIQDYDQTGSSGLGPYYDFGEGDQIDLSTILGSAYNHGGGQAVGALVHAFVAGTSVDLQVDPDGTANGTQWTTIAHLDGLLKGYTVNVILDPSQTAGVNISVTGPLPNDFNEDGGSDIVWRNDNGAASIWDSASINNAHTISSAGVVPNSWHVAGSGDFADDGKSDLLWRNDDGSVSIWNNGSIGGAHVVAGAGVVSTSWHIAGIGDFDGNGHSDILWRNDNGAVSIWNNGDIAQAHVISGAGTVASSWHIQGVADFNGDGHADILWRNDNGATSIWDSGSINNAHVIASAGVVPSSWHIAGTGDFAGDGHADILWRNDNGAVSIWDNGTLAGAHVVANAGVVPSSWHIETTGDFAGDGKDDILWGNDNGAVSIWNNGDIAQAHVVSAAGAVPTSWHIQHQQYDLV
ncbi:VCBS repeat-containing protein [Bradyrhizobium tropiciagri]|uniref:beta strand repeat-containing protein n=1 Tax=Bradyrhizobium tropiciagri TaxID=312253 RepID=UPI001BAC91F5|nr:FG-GAP-like repeat-containing protein [Bradyrhizobium tropiciagri]MBR0875060.1 VCBS repeat-containing protein [Bradyrhizobium tropiciagri]